eukprot:TRINITY_DN62084_c0_g1_i1.p1 TRINITY_DN62084_c0_g1~~TRINITY_DN62084_c0_g1_i1.p1  ORF type:complete len:415 (+),score=49.06 TRINITY_DN62084_c0_g1_i1:38-1282(+)
MRALATICCGEKKQTPWRTLRMVRANSTVLPPSRLFGAESVSRRPVITSVDCHCGGLPARVVVNGAPNIPGESADEMRLNMMKGADWLRTLMLTEPRGYPCQNLNIIMPATPACPEAAFSYVIAENHPCYPAMSGHNTICVVTALLETGMVPMTEPVTHFILEAPAGPIKIKAICKNGKCQTVTFRNAPAFARVCDLGLEIDIPQGDIRNLKVDVAYGGMWYAIIKAEDVGLRIHPDDAAELARIGEMVKIATAEQHSVHHPTISDPGWNTLIRGPPNRGGDASNAVIMSTGCLDWAKPSTWTGNIDRSPCGTGTSAMMATMYAKGELELGKDFRHEGILGSTFTGKLLEEVTIGTGSSEVKAVVPEITGQAWITQYSQIAVDPSDPFPYGYTLGDIWADSRVIPANHVDMAKY